MTREDGKREAKSCILQILRHVVHGDERSSAEKQWVVGQIGVRTAVRKSGS